jgi:predicted site-specific integrase-resolvase
VSPADKIKAEYLTEEEMAEILELSVRTMRTYRTAGKDHPPFVKVGRAVKYPAKEFYIWLEKKKLVRSVS